MADIVGTEAGDTLTGTTGADVIDGLGGNDTISGDAGNDLLRGGAGQDVLSGGAGDDRLEGGTDADTLDGGSGNDFLDGGDGADTFSDLLGSDTIIGGSGADLIYVFRYNDFSSGHNITPDTVRVDAGADNDYVRVGLYNGSSLDINAGTGEDLIYLFSLTGSLSITLGSGRDIVELDPNVRFSPQAFVITDFETGNLGDKLQLSSFLESTLTNWNGSANPFSTGHLKLTQQAGNAVLQIDRDGGGDGYSALLTFQGLNASTLTAFNIGGWTPGASVFGTSDSDHLSGSAIADFMFGYAGNDVLTGGAGNDVLDGGTGVDTAVYSGLFRSYDVHVQNGFGTVAGGGEGGTDSLTSVELLQFQDGVFDFNADGAAAQVTRLYDTVLQRGPDQVGLDYWVDRIEDQGGTLKQISVGFLNSAEFQALTGNLSNAGYVDFLYQNALGRPSDASGRAYWVDQLQSGAQDRADLLIGFSESQEHRDLTADLVGHGFFNTDDDYQAVALLYDTFSGRLPDAGGLIYWAEGIENGTFTLHQVADGFADSSEFRNLTAGMSNSQLVNFLYQNTLDRPADPSGLQYWTARLDGGMDRGDLLIGFSQSSEHFNLLGAHVTSGIDYLS